VLEEFEKPLDNLITGWFQLMKEVQVATTFEQRRRWLPSWHAPPGPS
jgi:hypothetical protein